MAETELERLDAEIRALTKRMRAIDFESRIGSTVEKAAAYNKIWYEIGKLEQERNALWQTTKS